MQDSGMARFRQMMFQNRLKSDAPGVAVHVEYKGLRRQMLTFPKRRPFAFAVGLNAVICVGADCFAQQYEQRKEHERKAGWNWSRSCVFFAFGAMQGVVQYVVYINVFFKLCPNSIRFANSSWSQKLKDKAGQRDLVKQVLLDSFAYVPFVYFPNFYMIKSFVYNYIEGGSDVLSSCWIGLDNYRQNFWEDNIISAICWLPCDGIIFCCVPWLRLPLSISVNLFWTAFLSSLRGRSSESSEVVPESDMMNNESRKS